MTEMDYSEIKKIVDGLAPVDWLQIELLRNLPLERRIIPSLRAREFAMAAYRGTLKERYPGLSRSELNMKVLAHFTPVRMEL
ncbi:MAG: hypothetical protein FJ010_03840 [Chloroflexi bacterium]|nr:hypothetical protein [Chloroflexota bacterium]